MINPVPFLFGLSAVLLGTSTGSYARAQADQSIERTDPEAKIAHQQLLAKARQGRVDLYFLGDSITRRWGAIDYPELLAHWNETFFGWNAANFGWGGDKTQNIIWRLENGELDGVNPKVVVLLAGTNNIGRNPHAGTAGEIAAGVRKILDIIQTKAPHARIILMAVFPRNDIAPANATIQDLNIRIAKFADGDRIRFLDINHLLADPTGRLHDEVTTDKLHLTLTGYRIWGEALKPLLLELLGPPAEVDHAPPPTGKPQLNSE
jgi:Lysophospholipase L1 and related esterases